MSEWRRNTDRRETAGLALFRTVPGVSSLNSSVLLVFAVLTLMAPAKPPWRSQVAALPRITISIDGVPLQAEVARTPDEQQRGLGYRDGLANDSGMLFVYDEAAAHTFWMKGMRFCLDIVWIERGTIVGAAEGICPAAAGTSDAGIPRARAPEPVHDVLEVPAGWLAAHGLGIDSAVVTG